MNILKKVLTFGEIMLRFSTEVGELLQHSNHLNVCYGGGEANVAVNLANFGIPVSHATKVPANSLGQAVKHHFMKYGVKLDVIIEGGNRLGTYYLESGVGQRAASVVYDRADSSFATMTELEWDLEELFHDVQLFHISGIVPAISEAWAELTIDLIKFAKSKGVKVSFDVNFRGKMWRYDRAVPTLAKIFPLVDYCSAGRMDAKFLMALDIDVENDTAETYYAKMSAAYPNIELFYATERTSISSSHNKLQGQIWREGKVTYSEVFEINPIVDRVGGGDAYTAGILYGLLTGKADQYTVSFATAASSLKHTINGDCNQFGIEIVESFMENRTGKIVR